MGEKHDNVNHPDHYKNIAGVEAIDILNDVVKDLPGKQASMLWNTLKYLLRFQKKNGVEDLKKAQNYLQWLIDDVETCIGTYADGSNHEISKQQDKTIDNIRISISTKNMEAFGRDLAECFREAWRSMQPGKISENLDNFCEKAKKNLGDESQRYCMNVWHSNFFGEMRIYSAFSKPITGMPVKLSFDTKDAAIEFETRFYSMFDNGYDEFSIADVALEMMFKIPKNSWDDLIKWEDKLYSFNCKAADDGRYELIFIYKDSSSSHETCIVYDSNTCGRAEVYGTTDIFPGECTRIRFESEQARTQFAVNFLQCLGTYSIRELFSVINYDIPETYDEYYIPIKWADIFGGFMMIGHDGKYDLDFIYKRNKEDK